MKAAIYERISQDREGLQAGVTRQDEDCRALAARLGAEVLDVYRDNDISASTRSRKPRPEYDRLIADAKTGAFTLVIAYTSGRLTRRPREHEDLIELAEVYGIRFEYVRSPSFDLNTAAGRRVARILAANDAGEAEDISERAQRAKLQAATAGRWLGGHRPYGYADDGTTIVPTEATVIRQAAADVLAGSSLRSIARHLNAAGITTATGAAWRPDTIRDVLMRARNAGLMVHRGEIIGPAAWPAILPEEQWRGLVAVLTDPRRRTQMNSARRWMLSGLATCTVCDQTVRCTLNGSTARGVPSYRCESTHVIRNAAETDAYISAVICARLARPDAIDLLQPDPAGPDLAALRAETVALQERLSGLATAYAEGTITAVQLRDGTARVRDLLHTADRATAAASRGSVLAGVAGVADVEAVWAQLDLDRRRAVIDLLMSVELLPARKGRPKGWRKGQSYFDPDSIRITWKT